ncbi:MAG: hypothetical protein B6A08_15895 [Sorangiineae bacterium NIC37A_2]|nr:MAG: hypothetical protein B6A08_15895 [Sorangiineae bacterium NIC37A_2]
MLDLTRAPLRQGLPSPSPSRATRGPLDQARKKSATLKRQAVSPEGPAPGAVPGNNDAKLCQRLRPPANLSSLSQSFDARARKRG